MRDQPQQGQTNHPQPQRVEQRTAAHADDIGFITGTSKEMGYYSSAYTTDYTRPPLSSGDLTKMLAKRRDEAIALAAERIEIEYPSLKEGERQQLAKMKVQSQGTDLHTRTFVTAAGKGYYQYAFEKDGTLYLAGYEYAAWRKGISVISLVLIMLCAFAAPASAVLSGFFYYSRIGRPMRRLADAVTKTGDEGRSRMVQIDREDEIGILSRSFNAMLGSLREARKDEKEARESAGTGTVTVRRIFRGKRS